MKLKNIFTLIKWIFASICFVIFLRLFFAESVKIPSRSMEPTLKQGDYIRINKLSFGPRIFKLDSLNNITIKRIKGLRTVKRNEVIAFNFPYISIYPNKKDKRSIKLNSCFIKRCVGLPGDTFYIKNGIFHIAGSNIILGKREQQKKLTNLELKNYIPEKFKRNKWSLSNWGPCYIPKKNDVIYINTLN